MEQDEVNIWGPEFQPYVRLVRLLPDLILRLAGCPDSGKATKEEFLASNKVTLMMNLNLERIFHSFWPIGSWFSLRLVFLF